MNLFSFSLFHIFSFFPISLILYCCISNVSSFLFLLVLSRYILFTPVIDSISSVIILLSRYILFTPDIDSIFPVIILFPPLCRLFYSNFPFSTSLVFVFLFPLFPVLFSVFFSSQKKKIYFLKESFPLPSLFG